MRNFFRYIIMLVILISCTTKNDNKTQNSAVNNSLADTTKSNEPAVAVPDGNSVANNLQVVKNSQNRIIEKKEDNNSSLNLTIQSADGTNALLKKIISKPEYFNVNSTTKNIFKTAKGTTIVVPQDCLLNEKGFYERGNIVLEVIETERIGEYFALGLPTIADDRTLESAGIVYLNASAEGKPLKIVKDKNIDLFLSFPKKDKDMLLFDWSGSTWMNQRNPAMVKNKKRNAIDGAFKWEILSSTTGKQECTSPETYYGVNSRIDKKNEKDFFERIKLLSAFNAIADCDNYNLNLDSYITYYLNASGVGFNSIDTKVYDLLNKNRNYYNKKEQVCINTPSGDTLYRGIKDIFDQFQLYSLKENWMSDDISTYNLDINSKESIQQFNQKNGPERSAAEQIVAYFKFKDELEQKRNEAKASYVAVEQMNEKQAQFAKNFNETIDYAFSVNKLGWINIDKFINNPNTVPAEVAVKINGAKDIGQERVGIVFKNRKSYLELIPGPKGEYILAKGNIPLNEPVKLIALFYKDQKVFFSERDIQINGPVKETLDLKEIELADLKEKLSSL